MCLTNDIYICENAENAEAEHEVVKTWSQNRRVRKNYSHTVKAPWKLAFDSEWTSFITPQIRRRNQVGKAKYHKHQTP